MGYHFINGSLLDATVDQLTLKHWSTHPTGMASSISSRSNT